LTGDSNQTILKKEDMLTSKFYEYNHPTTVINNKILN